MKRIAIHGSYFGLNFGDTLLCRLFADWASDAGASIVLPTADRSNREIIGARSRGLPAAFRAEGLLFCGGGYFSEPGSSLNAWSRRAYIRHIWLAEHAMLVGRPLAIIGVGAGPITVPWLQKKVRAVFEYASVVVVRDQESLEHLRALGVERPITVATDAALSLSPKRLGLGTIPDPAGLTRLRDMGLKVLLLHTNSKPTAQELEGVREALKWARDQETVGVILANDSVLRRSKCTWPQQLSEEFGELKGRIETILYEGDPATLVSLLSKIDGVVTSKLHVGIVSTALEKPVLSLPKHSKTPRFYRQMGLPGSIDLSGDWQAELGSGLDKWAQGELPDFSQMRKIREEFSYAEAVKSFIEATPGL